MCGFGRWYVPQWYSYWSDSRAVHCIRCILAELCPYRCWHIDTIYCCCWILSTRFRNRTALTARKPFSSHRIYVCWRSPGKSFETRNGKYLCGVTMGLSKMLIANERRRVPTDTIYRIMYLLSIVYCSNPIIACELKIPVHWRCTWKCETLFNRFGKKERKESGHQLFVGHWILFAGIWVE